MWSARSEELPDVRGLRFAIARDSISATFGEVIRAWQGDPGFRSHFNALLADAPYKAFRWEAPAVTVDTLSQPFEFVLLDSPGLARRPDPEAFAEHFAGATAGVAAFPNLGKDAIMVVPSPVAELSAYGHLAAFVRHAPELQRHALWQSVGEMMAQRVGVKPVWLSTAGAGVSWLHVRLGRQAQVLWVRTIQIKVGRFRRRACHPRHYDDVKPSPQATVARLINRSAQG